MQGFKNKTTERARTHTHTHTGLKYQKVYEYGDLIMYPTFTS
jgi:hypothetical protein